MTPTAQAKAPDPGGRRRLGVHTSIAGGIDLSLQRAKDLGCNTMQIFSHNPRTWALREICEEDAGRFRKLSKALDIRPVFIHASYLVNLASADVGIQKKSVEMLSHELETADLLGADHVVLHPGRAAGQDVRAALKRAARALAEAYDRAGRGVGVLIENTAGQRGDISSTMALISEIIEKTPPLCVRGLCIDTCHAYAYGYDITGTEGIERLEEEIRRYIAPLKVELVHLNDSKKGLASGVDRHEHIGMGAIGLRGLGRFLAAPSFRSVPLVLETPKRRERDDRENLERVKMLLRYGPPSAEG